MSSVFEVMTEETVGRIFRVSMTTSSRNPFLLLIGAIEEDGTFSGQLVDDATFRVIGPMCAIYPDLITSIELIEQREAD